MDVSETIDKGVASLREHTAYLDGLPDGTVGKDPEPFLRGMAAETGKECGVAHATSFELVNL